MAMPPKQMAPHLTNDELDYMFEEAAKGMPVKKIQEKLKRWRAKSKQAAPCPMHFVKHHAAAPTDGR